MQPAYVRLGDAEIEAHLHVALAEPAHIGLGRNGTGEPAAGAYLVTWNGHGDALALHRINADGTLTLANSYTYSTWGTPATQPHNSIPDLGVRFLYVGEYGVQRDDFSGLGLQYMQARHYSPGIGRFLQPDPSALEANLYTYAESSPVTKMDPSGRIAWCAIPLIGWAACAFGVRVALWAGGSAVSFVGSALFKSSQAAPAVYGKGPLVLSMVRDAAGRVTSVSGTIMQATLRTGTAASHAARTWCCNQSAIYEAGHLIARVFGGPGGLRSGNIVAMLRTLNNRAYKQLENVLLRYAEAGYRVQIHVQPAYSAGSTVPYKITYWYESGAGRGGTDTS